MAALLCASALLLALAVALFAWSAGEEPVRALVAPELRPAPEPVTVGGAGRGDLASSPRIPAGIRIGSFERPEEVPGYGILERRRDDRDGARILRLLVDTRSISEPAFAAIARDIKARYAGYDLVSVEFTDSTTLLDYNGSALIFNTPKGAAQTGYVYGPPNNRGYLVSAAD